MIHNEDAYYTGYYRNVRALGAIPALVFDTIAGLLRASGGIGEISNSTLCDLLGCTKPTLLNAIDKLIRSGYVEKKNGDGRGNKSIYYVTKKGKENIPFMTEKGSKNLTERVKKFNEKGKEILPNKKSVNKELNKESGGVTREAQHAPLSTTTPQNFGNMDDFNEWWSLFTGDTEWQGEKENCERVWNTLQQSWRDNLVQMAKNGLRWRQRENDNPYWYLKNYNGETAQRELPYMRQGTLKFTRWLDEQERAGRKIAIMRYEGSLAYCLTSDIKLMESAGAQFLSVMERRTSE